MKLGFNLLCYLSDFLPVVDNLPNFASSSIKRLLKSLFEAVILVMWVVSFLPYLENYIPVYTYKGSLNISKFVVESRIA